MMQAMILAAGRGERLRPLTDSVPKPLIEVGGKTLIEHQIDRLKMAGVSEFVVNVSWLGQQIRDYLGTGQRLGTTVTYSDEGDQALETAGGIVNALPLLRSDPFIVCNADVWSDVDYSCLTISEGKHAHLLLTHNPPHNPGGDFGIDGDMLTDDEGERFTFTGIGIYRKKLFTGLPSTKQALAPLLRSAIAQEKVGGELFAGHWFDVGSPERLKELRSFITSAE